MSSEFNRKWCLTARPEGMIQESDFQLLEEVIPSPGDGEVLIRNFYLGLDPTNRVWTSDAESYMPPVELGEVMRAVAMGVVEESRNSNLPVGTIVQGLLGWQDYAIDSGDFLTVIEHDNATPLTAYFDIFGHIGLTAYFGLLDIGKPAAGETLVVSAAAGSVGSLVGQIGKLKGCRVVGIAGGQEKCRWITEELGFDAAVNYKKEQVSDSLRSHCPNGIDIIFENVGGTIFDAALEHINDRARIVLCGLIAQYNTAEPVPGPYNLMNILMKRARMEGFIVMDYMARGGEAMPDLAQWFAEGKLKTRIELIEGLENTVGAINRLFDGNHKGKMIVKISEVPGQT